jgi:hypothetical protein
LHSQTLTYLEDKPCRDHRETGSPTRNSNGLAIHLLDSSVAMLALTTETDPANHPIRRELQLPANRASIG